MRTTISFLILLLLTLCMQPTCVAQPTQAKKQDQTLKPIPLFQGKSLEDWGWAVTNFGGEGEVQIVNDEIIMEAGFPMSGIHRAREEKLPTSNYELELEAKRLEGIDFFCAMTFPVQSSHCTMVVAGWAGATVGLSCVDDQDASSNETTSLMKFEDNQWYKIKVRVTDEAITGWIDDKQVFQQRLEGHKISVRGDITASRPFGLAAFESRVAYRNIRLTPIKSPTKQPDTTAKDQ